MSLTMSFQFSQAKIEVTAPSNIAWIKYWGKKGNQLAINPSLSMTLKKCLTRSKVEFNFGKSDDLKLFFQFEGKDAPRFIPKVKSFLSKIRELYPFVSELASVHISSENTFPHSSGIASSASAFSALALAFEEVQAMAEGKSLDLERAGHAARLGSGSACRSFYDGFTLWGEIRGEGSDTSGVKLENIHSKFAKLYNAICIVSSEEKEVGSSAGHALMEDHIYKSARTAQAKKNCESLMVALQTGNIELAGEILEEEALSLHGLMATSRPSFILMRPNTLSIIEQVKAFRKEHGPHVYFTLDAGPNPHLIYPEESKGLVEEKLLPNVKAFCEEGRIIMDENGPGAMVIESNFQEPK